MSKLRVWGLGPKPKPQAISIQDMAYKVLQDLQARREEKGGFFGAPCALNSATHLKSYYRGLNPILLIRAPTLLVFLLLFAAWGRSGRFGQRFDSVHIVWSLVPGPQKYVE